MIRLVVTGSRDYVHKSIVRREILALGKENIEILIHGDARGLDTLAKEVGEEEGIPTQAEPCTDEEWRTLGKKAGVLRNQRMIDKYKPTYGLAFPLPGSRGTWDMVNRMKAANIPYKVV
jgi:YspA, cpYpsA-related SLOG family